MEKLKPMANVIIATIISPIIEENKLLIENRALNKKEEQISSL